MSLVYAIGPKHRVKGIPLLPHQPNRDISNIKEVYKLLVLEASEILTTCYPN